MAVVVVLPELPDTLVWSPVLEPDTVVVPVTARVGVELPDKVTPLMVVGVIAPRVNVMVGVVVAVATLPDIPLAVVTDTDVTVPEPPPPPDGVCQLAAPFALDVFVNT